MFSADVMRADVKRVVLAVIRVQVMGDDTQASIKIDSFVPDRQGDSFVNGIRMMHAGNASGKVDMNTGKMTGIIPNTLASDVAQAIADGLKFVSGK